MANGKEKKKAMKDEREEEEEDEYDTDFDKLRKKDMTKTKSLFERLQEQELLLE
jgi:outer membrane protein assembly factor BamD (BamD/ComL family)